MTEAKFPEMLKRRGMTLESYQARCQRFKFLGELLKDNSAVLGFSPRVGRTILLYS